MAETSELERRVALLKDTIAGSTGRNVADAAFAREVDELLGVFYEDVGQIKQIRLRSLFDLFLIKVLYVNRHSQDSAVLDYLADLLTRFLWSREIVAPKVEYDFLFAILAELIETHHAQNVFEVSRKLGDNALFVTGMFPGAAGRRLRWRRREPQPRFERDYFMEMGRRYYRLAADQDLAEVVGQRETLQKLASYFEIYSGALNEMSERYIMGFDMRIIADKMLDSFNRYRRTGDRQHLEAAQKYAALLRVDRARFPRLFGPPPGA